MLMLKNMKVNLKIKINNKINLQQMLQFHKIVRQSMIKNKSKRTRLERKREKEVKKMMIRLL